ncbi:hypothetical protein VTK26DRAFT_5460 [Humicola hyalothermophila]
MSFDSNGSQGSLIIPLSDYLSAHDHDHFVWDDANREASAAWLAPVDAAGLNHRKHKVFHHCNKEYLKPPNPFIQHGPELGESGSTVVYKVTSPDGINYRRPMALKVIVCKENVRPPGPDSKARSDALKEVATTARLRHPHIVAYVASFEDYCIQTREVKHRPSGKARAVFKVDQRIKRHILGIAMYPPAQCNLHTFMNEVFHNPRESDWMLAHIHTYFGCLAQAVAYLHRQNVQIRHKDIKPENIVIDDFGVPILTDFGLSKHFETGQYSQGPTPKTLKYADPEAIQEESRGERSDIFSLGCVYLEMATVLLGKPPFFAEEQLGGASRSAGEFKYAESLHNLDAYLNLLATRIAPGLVAADPARDRSARAVLAVLYPIRRMMNGSQWRRPKAHDLYPWFRHLYDVHEHPGPCHNCEEERRSGMAIFPSQGPSRSGSGSPTLNRSGAVGSTSIIRRGTGQSMAFSYSQSGPSGGRQVTESPVNMNVWEASGEDSD